MAAQHPSTSLRRLRMDMNLSRRAAAKQAGCSEQHLWWLERGKGVPRDGLLQALAAVYGKRPSELEDAIRRDLTTRQTAEVA